MWGGLVVLSVVSDGTRTELGAQESEEVAALITQVLEAYGGAEALDTVRAYTMRGIVHPRQRRTPAPVLRVFQRPGQLAVRIDYQDRFEARVVDQSRGWRSTSQGTPTEVTGPLLAAMELQAARAELPWILDRMHDSAVPIPAPSDAPNLLGLELPLGEGLALQVFVDPATHYVVRSVGSLAMGGMATSFGAVYSDHRMVAGVVFPFREETTASGVATAMTVVTEIELNPVLEEGTFHPR
jgi:hypothetical protein